MILLRLSLSTVRSGSLDFSDPEESQFFGVFSDGLLAKSEPILSMSAFQKPPQAALLDYDSARSLQDGTSYSTYGQTPYVSTPLVPSPMADHVSQISDCVPYMGNHEYASSYEEGQSPMMTAEPRQLPEVISYSPQRGSEGTRVYVQIQSPYDLHTSSYAILYIVFGSKKCECIPHFVGFQDSSFQYALSIDTPPFASTGSSSLAVPLQVAMDGQNDCPSTTLQVGVYTYEHAGQYSPADDDTRKRRIAPFTEETITRPIKRATPLPMQGKEEQSGYAAPYSPYLQPVPSSNGFPTPYHATSSPRVGPMQYSAASQASIRAPSPMTPSWSPSYLSVSHEPRSASYAIAHTLRQQKPSSPARFSNPTLIRTSTLQQSSGLIQSQSFNPYAMYPSKAVLKLNGDLDSMTENWTAEERDAKRRLVQFTRMQNGSTIHADFKPVAPEDRAPNSICISCIYWGGKDECFVTSVDTIYLLESLVGVRFTVEEKNRIRRNLEGFRPLTVSKAKADSEDFFKVIMGFPAPKPRNIEKDVKVFPWKILSHALKKIIGKYSASYSSTAGALPTSIGSNYASTGAASDSGTEPHNATSPQSVSEGTPSSNYGPNLAAPIYSPPTESAGPPMIGGTELRAVLPSVSQSYSTMAAPYSYPPVCHQQNQLALTAPVPRAWELNSLVTPPTVSGAPSYSYMAPMSYPVPGPPHGP
ncbi:hypothetical protein P175DRAFT_0510821 [Aspergillus ochraceoroseus IBT 24754]|uniref:DUF7082 domain-containing protein n=1 Tax=Aspergillus ochraceoroseus IBT 24754 TaxID=1392256 RepID=A0A2T5LTH4_9EURO|nr:uncharacterized protein P175DRAFT_0510821 [Aspergillus ochraceoroseus IBT 24754]PTU19584.1 hypothetical protein P175DRAFT_0510821 [Aspergillus ochraceoroseus IBT 24754]